MNDTLMLDVSQAHELKMGFRRHDYDNALIKQLSEGDNLGKVREFLLGRAEFKPIDHIIDLDADDFPTRGPTVRHRKGGQFKWDPTKLMFHLSKKQQGKKVVYGHDLRDELMGKLMLNANLLDYLIKPENQHLIPESWKKDEKGRNRNIYFWGTIFCDSRGKPYVRYMCFGVDWTSHCTWMDECLLANDYALMFR
jgi:hypothetical protein